MWELRIFDLQVTKLLSKLDDFTEYIQKKLSDNNLDQRVNVIHLSDHGMSSVIPPNFIDLTEFVRNETVSFYGTSPILQVVPKDNSELLSILYFLHHEQHNFAEPVLAPLQIYSTRFMSI